MKGMRAFSDVEIEKLLDGFTGKYAPRNRLLFLFRLKTGLRVTEALSIKIKDLLLPNGKVGPRFYLPRKNTKGRSEGRDIPLHPLLIKELESFIKDSSQEYLFKSRKGRGVLSNRSVWRIERHICNLLGIDCRKVGTHSVRKTFAKRIHRAYGGDILKTRIALGHKDLSSTIHYLSIDDEEVDRGFLES